MKKSKFKFGDEVVWLNTPNLIVVITDITKDGYCVNNKSSNHKGYWFSLKKFEEEAELYEIVNTPLLKAINEN